MARNRTGKFWWEYKKPGYITLESLRGEYDPALSSDCRCGRECETCEFGNICELRPWIALCSAESWGEEMLNPDGRPYGDYPDPDVARVVFEGDLACDIFGNPYNGEDEEEVPFEEIVEQRRIDKELSLITELEDDEEYFPCFNGFESLAEEPSHERLVAAEDEIGPPPVKTEEYDQVLPTHLSKSHQIVVKHSWWKSRKSFRMDGTRNGSYSHGWRGNDRYKNLRTSSVRVSRGKFRRIARNIGHPFVFDLDRGQAPRVPIV